MRAEVGLLTRNLKFRGDPETSLSNEYGATIFLHSSGDDSLTARLAYCEFTDMGQAFKLGRYAIHFHMIGNVHNSYVKGNAVHQSFNRAFTFHGTNFLRLERNVVYNVKGHNIFIEDAVERHNIIKENLIIMTKRSMSLLNTDATPGSMWITNPNNEFIGNHAAGSDRYSYWFDLQTHAMGPSASNDVCPDNEPLGVFRDNHAHSNGRYGLRIFHDLVPRTYPCRPIIYDPTNETDPYWQNPLITANFETLTAWKNKRNGAIAGQVGDVRYNNFKVADSILANIEFEETYDTGYFTAMIQNAVLIGRSANTEEALDFANPRGIITPRSDNFVIDGVKFFSYDFGTAAGIGSCSHCWHPSATDSGAREVKMRNLIWDDATVPRRLRFQTPWHAIYKDLDGSLTGLGPDTWATPYKEHFEVPECTTSLDIHDGVICDSTNQMRRVVFYDAKNIAIFEGMHMNVLLYDDEILGAQTSVEDYKLDRSKYSRIEYKDKQNPVKSWPSPYLTGHKYKVSWGGSGLDFDQMKIMLSDQFEETDGNMIFIHNYTDVRAKYEVRAGSTSYDNATLQSFDVNFPGHITGQNHHFNATGFQSLQVVVNGKDLANNKIIQLVGHRCDGPCVAVIDEVETEDTKRYWSDPTNWPNETLPEDGATVDILPGWDMIYDLEETSPVFDFINVNGILTFSDEHDTHLRARHIFIRMGELHIGAWNQTYEHNAKIELMGEKENQHIVFTGAIEAGNKLIANVGTMKMYGKPRTQTMTRLRQPVEKGATSLLVETGLDLVEGDRLALAPTSYDPWASSDVTVSSYDEATGALELTSGVSHYHWGAEDTIEEFEIDMRGEVMILTRNIVIEGQDVQTWGGQVITSDMMEADLSFRYGHTIMDHVEIKNCSQIDTQKAAVRFTGAVGGYSSVTNSAIHNGHGWGINVEKSQNVHLSNNIIYNFKPVGVAIQTSGNITYDRNILSHVYERVITAMDQYVDPRGGVCICSLLKEDRCTDLVITDNIVAGAAHAGFIAPGHDCGDTAQKSFRGNVAHSVQGHKGGHGVYAFPNPASPTHSTCYEVSHFSAYKNYLQGAMGYGITKHQIFSNMHMVDNILGVGMMIAGKSFDYDEQLMEMKDMKIYGESPLPDCPSKTNGDYCFLEDKLALFPGVGTFKTKPLHPQIESQLPIYKVKSDSTWGCISKHSNLHFKGFRAVTQTGMKSTIFGSHHYASDYTPPVWMSNITFEDVDHDSFALFEDPNPKWANLKDCGSFPCTAPNNLIYTIDDVTWLGDTPSFTHSNFQLIADNDGFAPFIPNCNREEVWNGYVCQRDTLAVLQFESQDVDRWDRTASPINLTRIGTAMKNVINTHMDHVWDGFYAGQIRQSRYPAIVDAELGSVYDVVYTGTPPKKQLFELITQNPNLGMTIRIPYPEAAAYQVSRDGKVISMNDWDDELQSYGPITQTKCGENRFIPVKNILEFYIESDCQLVIEPRNAIMTKVRMEWTLEEFYSDGGTTAFVDRISASLGIHASSIKVVGVYEGSLIVDYNIFSDNNNEAELEAIQQQQTELIATGGIDLGAPVLDFEAAGESIVSDGVVSAAGYDPIRITVTNNAATAEAEVDRFATNTQQAFQQKDGAEEVSIFNPEIEIVEDTIQKQKQEEIFAERLAARSSSHAPIIIGALVIVAVIMIALVARCTVNYARKQAIDLDRIKKVQDDFEMAEQHDLSQFKSPTKNFNKVDPNSSSIHSNTMDKMVVQYAPQYDANHDFAIFGTGDGAQGGIQTLQQKMNIADQTESTQDKQSSTQSNSNHEQRANSRGLEEDREISIESLE